jgi:hemolysin III
MSNHNPSGAGKLIRGWIREPVNSLTHLITAVVALVGTSALVYLSRGDLARQGSLLIYGASLVLLFASSGLYHLVQGSSRRIQFFRKLDHSAIFLLIAGTYTPLCFNLFDGFWRWGMLAIIWSLAIAGTVSKIFVVNTPRWFTATVYLVMGWLAVFAIKEILAVLPVSALIWLLAGGIVFSLGALVYITKIFNFKPGIFGFHEVWHIFVILGALCHYILVLFYVAAA